MRNAVPIATAASAVSALLNRAGHDHELGEEAGERRHAHDRESTDEEYNRGNRHGADEPAKLADVLRVGLMFNHTGAEEERGLAQPVGKEIEDAPGQRDLVVKHRKAEEDVAELAHGRVRQDALDVILHQGGAGRDKGRADGNPAQQRRGVRRQGEGVAEEPGKSVDADFDQHRGVEQAGDGRGRDAGVRQPGMKRERG